MCSVTGMAWKEQREASCGIFTMTQFKLCGRQAGASYLLLFLNTVEMMEYIMQVEDYDLTHKSMAMNMCLTNLKEMGKAFC